MPQVLSVPLAPRAVRSALCLTFSLLGVHCGGVDTDLGTGGTAGTSSDSTTTPTDVACDVNELKLVDGRCQPPGLPFDMPCPPGETPLPDGACQPAGVPPRQCGVGFEADGLGGCHPVLPLEVCAKGLMAIPGETACREVAPCGDGTWGDIPTTATTQFVDGSFAGLDSDGTQTKPWKTIQEGVDAAADGAVVAIAEGSYTENVEILPGNPVQLWGRCPAKVTLVGSGPNSAAVAILADGAEVHNLAVTASGLGLGSNADDVVIEGVHVHDTGSVGLIADAASITVRNSLFERTHRASVLVQAGAKVVVETSHLKNSLASPGGNSGRGVETGGGSKPSSVTLRRTLIERSDDAAISGDRADLTLEQTAVRDTLATVSAGVGISITKGTLTVRESTVERVHAAGIEVVGSVATLERTTVADTLPLTNPNVGYHGIRVVEYSATKTPSDVTLRACAITGSHNSAVAVFKSTALIESTLARNNMLDLKNPKGAPITIDSASATVRTSALVENQGGGLLVRKGEVTFDSSVVRDVKLDLGFGACIAAVRLPGEVPSVATVISSLLQDCSQVGALVYHGNLTVQSSIVRNVLPNFVGDGGDAISVINQDMPDGTLVVQDTLVDEPTRAGIASFGGVVTVERSAVVCSKYPVVSEPFGTFSPALQAPTTSLCGCPEAAEVCQIETPGLAPSADL